MRRLYNWTMEMATHRHAIWVLAFVAFVESSFFPIPPDILLIPMVLAAPRRAFLIAGVATVASVLGGIFGYMIGAFAFETIGQPMLQAVGKGAYFEEFAQRYNDYGLWVVLAAGVTPFPYKVVTILSGATGLSFGVFVMSSIVARALRFFVVAGLLWYIGPPVRTFIEKHLGVVFTVFIVLLFGGLYLVRFI